MSGLDYGIDGRPMSVGAAFLEAVRRDPALKSGAPCLDEETPDGAGPDQT
ncbi:hypothetical protein [Mycolicibacterium fortuitum]|nr:hypothetical protein [Mycolicibacterium fortuitum]